MSALTNDRIMLHNLNSGGKTLGRERLGGDTTEPLLLFCCTGRVWPVSPWEPSGAPLPVLGLAARWDVALVEEHGPVKLGGLANLAS